MPKQIDSSVLEENTLYCLLYLYDENDDPVNGKELDLRIVRSDEENVVANVTPKLEKTGVYRYYFDAPEASNYTLIWRGKLMDTYGDWYRFVVEKEITSEDSPE